MEKHALDASFSVLIFRIWMVIVCIFSWINLNAQLDNSSFYHIPKVDSTFENKLYISVSHMGFFKDNEYTNKIANGYTLFGNQLTPALVYFPLKNVRLKAGIFLSKDFGNNRYSEISPILSATIKLHDVSFIFGSVEGSLNHCLAEPLYNFENSMLSRNENGMQVILDKKSVYLDTWVDWKHMLYAGDTIQEKIWGGLSSKIKIVETKGTGILIPFQFTALHQGGQIDASPLPLKTILNLATGLRIDQKIGNGFVKSLGFQPYFLVYEDMSFEKTSVYNKGNAIYLNLNVKTKITDLMISYWQGNKYVSPYGGLLYNSLSTTFKHPEYTEPKRQLLMLRLLTDFNLSDEFVITTRFEPFYDMTTKKMEFSLGVYINYNDLFLLKQIKAKE